MSKSADPSASCSRAHSRGERRGVQVEPVPGHTGDRSRDRDTSDYRLEVVLRCSCEVVLKCGFELVLV